MKEKETFEEDIKRLEKIVDDLASGKLTLAESLKKYEEGIKLARGCSTVLNEAQRRVELLMKKEGKFSLEKFEDKESKEEEGS
jgi:exodeoxyribonuclease VII small subunit